MGAHHAALFGTPTLLRTGDRLCRAMAGSQYYSGTRLLCGADSLGMSTGERKGVTPIRSEATPARGDDDEPKYHLFRQPAPGGAGTATGSFHQQLRSVAKPATTKTEGWGMDETTTNEEVEDSSEQLEGESIYCDVLPHSLVYQFLHLASRICDEADSEFKGAKSKKSQRLSTTSSDLLD